MLLSDPGIRMNAYASGSSIEYLPTKDCGRDRIPATTKIFLVRYQSPVLTNNDIMSDLKDLIALIYW